MGTFLLRLIIWFLLTANLSVANIVIGVVIALVLPRQSTSPERLKVLLLGFGKILLAIPQAYQESLELIFNPHTEEEIVLDPMPDRRSPGQIFLDIFLITFTPKTTVLNYRPGEGYEVHRVTPRRRV